LQLLKDKVKFASFGHIQGEDVTCSYIRSSNMYIPTRFHKRLMQLNKAAESATPEVRNFLLSSSYEVGRKHSLSDDCGAQKRSFLLLCIAQLLSSCCQYCHLLPCKSP
jgi:hypothetical protein